YVSRSGNGLPEPGAHHSRRELDASASAPVSESAPLSTGSKAAASSASVTARRPSCLIIAPPNLDLVSMYTVIQESRYALSLPARGATSTKSHDFFQGESAGGGLMPERLFIQW